MDPLLSHIRDCRACAAHFGPADLVACRPDLLPTAPTLTDAPYLREVDCPGDIPLTHSEWSELSTFLNTRPDQWNDVSAVFCRPVGGAGAGLLAWVAPACQGQHPEVFQRRQAARRVLSFTRYSFLTPDAIGRRCMFYGIPTVGPTAEYAAAIRVGRVLHLRRCLPTGERVPWILWRNTVLTAWLDQTKAGIPL